MFDIKKLLIIDALKFIPGEVRDLLRIAPRIAIDLPEGQYLLDKHLEVFFLERASASNFCCATGQNNPHILKYVSYDRSCLLQPCGKLFSLAPPVPLGNFYL